MLRGDIGYADGYNGKPLPFFKVFYAGGVGSVRGYETASLGPQDIYGNAIGGKRKIVGNAELFYPILKGDKSVRVSVFFDAGQISGDSRRGRRPCANLREGRPRSSATRTASGSPGTRRSGRLKFSYGIPAQETARRQDPALPVPGRLRVLSRLCRRNVESQHLSHWARHPRRRRPALARRGRRGRRRLQDRLRQHRAAVPRGRAGQARAAEAREGVRRARRRDPEAQQAGARPAGAAREGRRHDVRDRAPQQGARPRQPVARPAARRSANSARTSTCGATRSSRASRSARTR